MDSSSNQFQDFNQEPQEQFNPESVRVRQRMLNNNELAYFCSQIALVLHSGISALEGITMMLEDNTDKKDTAILKAIQTSMVNQGYLYVALRDIGVFPPYMVHMVEIGEETGNLDDVMDSLSKHYEREESIRTSISQAVTYPLIMSGMILAVIVVLLVRVMPIFSQVFAQLGTEMTGIAAGLATIGDVINQYSLVFIIVFAAIILIAVLGIATKAGRGFFKSIGKSFKSIRDLSQRISAARFADGMALTIRSGLTPDRSFELVSSLNEDPVFARKLAICKNEMEQGKGLADALHISGIFTGVYSRMASIGYKAGAMDSVMEHIADLYQDEIDTRINNTLSSIEPALIIVLSIIVGVILVSVMFPLLSVMSSL